MGRARTYSIEGWGYIIEVQLSKEKSFRVPLADLKCKKYASLASTRGPRGMQSKKPRRSKFFKTFKKKANESKVTCKKIWAHHMIFSAALRFPSILSYSCYKKFIPVKKNHFFHRSRFPLGFHSQFVDKFNKYFKYSHCFTTFCTFTLRRVVWKVSRVKLVANNASAAYIDDTSKSIQMEYHDRDTATQKKCMSSLYLSQKRPNKHE